MPSDDSSQALLARFQNGDSQAAQEVFDRYVMRLVSLVRCRISPRLQQRVDPDDVVQSAMRSFFVKAANEGYVLQRAGDLWRLLATISLSKLRRQVELHTAAKRAVAKEHRETDNLDHLVSTFDRQPLPEEELALHEELQQLMQNSSPAQREALQLRLAGETVEAIAQTMGRSQRTIRRLLQTSREELEQRLATIHDG